MVAFLLGQFGHFVARRPCLFEIAEGVNALQLQHAIHHNGLPIGDLAQQFRQFVIAHLRRTRAASLTLHLV